MNTLVNATRIVLHTLNPKYCFFLLLLTSASQTAQSVSFTYFKDDASGLDVLIQGTGDAGLNFEVSPSSIWAVGYNVSDIGFGPSFNVAELEALVERSPFLGFPVSLIGPVFKAHDELAVPLVGSGSEGGLMFDATFTLNSGIAVADWEWSYRIVSQETSSREVFDGGNTTVLIGLALLSLSFVKRRFSRRSTEGT